MQTTLTIIQLASLYDGMKKRKRDRISSEVSNAKSVYYTKKDEVKFLHDIDILDRAIVRLKNAIEICL